jgi:hypothetical protein
VEGSVIQRRTKTRFKPSNASDVHQRFIRLVKKASDKAESEAAERLAVKPTIQPPAVAWRRRPPANRRTA